MDQEILFTDRELFDAITTIGKRIDQIHGRNKSLAIVTFSGHKIINLEYNSKTGKNESLMSSKDKFNLFRDLLKNGVADGNQTMVELSLRSKNGVNIVSDVHLSSNSILMLHPKRIYESAGDLYKNSLVRSFFLKEKTDQ